MSTIVNKIESILTSEYSTQSFVELMQEIFDTMTIVAPNTFRQEFSNFTTHIVGRSHVGNYTTPDDKKIAIFVVQLQKGFFVENSRSTQRSYAKKLIESGKCDAAVVAFFTPNDPKWRLSFVRLDYEMKIEHGKLKTKENLTPAKRYSYLVGQDEPCHTAIERFRQFILDNNSNPTLDELEEAFSVEKVTKEFFDLYCEKFYQFQEYLDSNEDFIAESQKCGFTAEQFAKKLMGQIVFLYFLQKKGWLGVNVWSSTLTEKEYNKVFYVSGAQGRIIKEYLPKIYIQQPDGTYRLNTKVLDEISDDDEEVIANHMVRNKTWGDGSKRFLRTIFNYSQKHKGHFFENYLEPLFYDTLNKNRGAMGYCPALHCRVPFLSGGLFEPLDGYDWKSNCFDIPDEMFSDKKDENDRNGSGILDIFDRYNFTMSEDEPMEREVAIDPEMLGKIFENLLEVKDRKSKGAFYTPREIVHYMCQESLINYLVRKTEISEDALRDFILYGDFMKDEDTVKEKREGNGGMYVSEEIFKIDDSGNIVVNRFGDIDNALATVKVADPAVGSGAFPLGMMNEIVRARENITAYMSIGMNAYNKMLLYKNERSPYLLKRETIKNSIFAVDIEPSAVDIAQLRLWLSLVIDDEITPNAQNELEGHRDPLPLPNLECNIICGNSLIDEFEGVKLVNESDILHTTHVGSQMVMGQSQFDTILEKLLKTQDELFLCDDPNKKIQLKEYIQSYKDMIIQNQFLNQGATDDTKEAYKVASKMASKPFTLWQLDFARVFRDNGGFDIVIGNPPYGAKFSAIEKRILNYIYADCNVPDYESADFFIELGFNILKPKGSLAFIIPNMFMANVLAEKYRRHLLDIWSINRIDNMSEIDVFESAKVRNCIVYFDKNLNDNASLFTKLTINNTNITVLKKKTFKRDSLLGNIDNWLNLIERDETALSIVKKIAHDCCLLKEISEISQGLIPYDKYRGHSEETIKNRIWNSDYQKDETYRKELRGQDISRYSLNWNGKDWLSYGEWLAAPRKPEFFIDKRILIREITNPRILATYTEEEYYNTPSIINCINFTIDPLFVLGIINSELISFYHNITSPKANKGLFPKILVNDVRNLPINTNNKNIEKEISLRVKKLLESCENNEEIDSEIDQLVYQLYGINDSEREYIQKWFESRSI